MKSTDAKWTFQDCPKCGHPFVAQDDIGLFCCLGDCGWNDYDALEWVCEICAEDFESEVDLLAHQFNSSCEKDLRERHESEL